jgi:hypothetical protein
MKNLLTPKKLALLTLSIAVVYLLLSFIYGIFLEITTYHSDLAELVNRNLLAPWRPSKEEFRITSRSNCPIGNGPDWPKTRKNCFYVGGWLREPCSPFNYGRSCATIAVSSILFNDEVFRDALRSALQDLCGVFKTPFVREYLANNGNLPMAARTFGCSMTRRVSLSMYIIILDNVADPPIGFREGVTKIADTMYFSTTTGEIGSVK